jgi:hypothetical protein
MQLLFISLLYVYCFCLSERCVGIPGMFTDKSGWYPNRDSTNVDSVAELRKKLMLTLSPSLRRRSVRDASSAEEAQLVKCEVSDTLDFRSIS